MLSLPAEQSALLALTPAIIRLAREDCATFCELILRDEETGDPIWIEPFQEEWIEALDRERHIVIWAHPESGKTQIIAIGRILWLLGRNPRGRYAILSASNRQAEKVVKTIKSHIEENSAVHQIFPDLKPGKIWERNMIEVVRAWNIKDPSVQAYSPEGGSIQGARLDGLVVDDVLTATSTWTKYQRDKQIEWVKASAFSRLTRNAWVAFLANAWHPEDLAHHLASQGWWSKKYPVVNSDGSSSWPSRWPMDRIEEQRQILLPVEFARQMMCEARDETMARFRIDWIGRCLEKGEGYHTHHSLEEMRITDPELASEIYGVPIEDLSALDAEIRLGGRPDVLPEGFDFVTGVDLAVEKKASSDLTVIFTILLWPDGIRHVIEIQSGRWHGPDILDRVVSVHDRFNSTVVVESNSAQKYIVQFARVRAPGLRIRSFHTGRNKINPEYGVESLAAELSAGKWLIPCQKGTRRPDREVSEWISEMMNYDPKAHTGDRLMAAWIAREYCRAIEIRRHRGVSGNSGVRVLGKKK